ncbi:MAG: LptF/LptG family permease [Puniceicoccaceae bacterium]
MLGRLHRYVLLEVCVFVLGAVSVFVFVFLTGNAVKKAVALLLEGQISLPFFLQILWLMVPYVALYALPLGFLAGILLALGRLSSTREILAMKAAGMSVASIGRPVFLLALLGCVLSAWFNNEIGPRNKWAYRDRLANSLEEDPLRFFKTGRFIRDFPGYVIFVEERAGDEMRGFRVWQTDGDGKVTLFIRADTAEIRFLREEGDLRLTLRGGTFEERAPNTRYGRPPEIGAMVAFEEFPIRLELDALLNRTSKYTLKPSYLTYSELRERIRDDPERALVYKVQIQQNFAMSVSVLALVVVAVPLGIRVGRKETLANLGIALALALFYYFLVTAATWFGDRPSVHPEILIWLPNLLYGGIGLWLIRRADRR